MTTKHPPNVHIFNGKLVAKRIFFRHQGPPILNIIFISESGQLIDLLSFRSERKSYTVYRKVQENRCYSVRVWGQLRKPNPKYSSSTFETSSWYIDDLDEDVEISNFVECSTNLQSAIEVLKTKTTNILGIYKGHQEGPEKKLLQRCRIHGYFLNLVDDSGQDFDVLIWHTKATMKASKFPLFRCKPGEVLFIPCARRSQGGFTSLFVPVIDSQCVESKHVIDLTRNFRRNN